MRLLTILSRITVICTLLIGGVIGGALLVGHTLPDGWQIRFTVSSNNNTILRAEVLDTERGLYYTMALPEDVLSLPLFSPDDRFILYTTATADLMIYDTTRNTITDTIPRSFANIRSWAPDSRRFTYVYRNTEGTETRIATLNDDGEVIATNTVTGDDGLFPNGRVHWSPDGERLAYINFNDASTVNLADVFIAEADGTNARRLSPTLRGVQWLAWSPDSQQLAVIWRDPATSGQVILSLVDVNTGEVLTLNTNVSEFYGEAPRWSPDGTRLALAMHDIGVVMYDIVTGEEQLVVNASLSPYAVRWSPNSDRLIFFGMQNNSFPAHIINLEGEILQTFSFPDNNFRAPLP